MHRSTRGAWAPGSRARNRESIAFEPRSSRRLAVDRSRRPLPDRLMRGSLARPNIARRFPQDREIVENPPDTHFWRDTGGHAGTHSRRRPRSNDSCPIRLDTFPGFSPLSRDGLPIRGAECRATVLRRPHLEGRERNPGGPIMPGSNRTRNRARRAIRRFLRTALALALLGLPSPARAASFTTVRLVDPNPLTSIVLTESSGDGRVLFGYRVRRAPLTPPIFEMVRWTADEGLQSIEQLEGPPPTTIGAASFDGSRFVTSRRSAAVPYGEALLWDQDTGTRVLETATVPGYQSEATSMTPDGSTIVGNRAVTRTQIPGTDFDSPNYEAFRWTEHGGLTRLFPDAASGSLANDVTADGAIVVGSVPMLRSTPTGTIRVLEAFTWSEEDGIRILGSLSEGEFHATSAKAISADGSTIVGGSAVSRALSVPFVHTAEGGMLGLYDAAGTDATATDVSADGRLVIGNFGTSTGNVPFIWDPDSGVRRLQPYLESLGVDLGGRTLLSADALLDDGRTIVGQVYDGGILVPYFATIPEPGPALLLGLGLIALARTPTRSSPANSA